MARDISLICDFIFGSIRRNLPMDTVDVDLTVRMIKGIYTYHKDHTVESTICTPWSKTVTPFPSLRRKIQAFKDDMRQNVTMPWNNEHMVQFFAPPKTPRNLRKHTLGKIRTRWSKRNHRFNPIKTRRLNTMNRETMKMNKTDVIKPVPKRVYECFGPNCSYCRQDASHPSLIHSDWSCEDWDGDKAKAKE